MSVGVRDAEPVIPADLAPPDPTPSRARPWTRFVPAAFAALVVGGAGVGFERVFQRGHAVGPLLVGVVIGFAVAMAARVLDQQVIGGLLAAIGAAVVSAVVTAWLFASPSPGFGTGVIKGVVALIGGWSRILTTSVPVPPSPDRLPLLGGVIGFGSAAGALLASRNPYQSRAAQGGPGLGALAPAGGVFVVALLLGVHGPGSLVGVTAPLLVLAAAYLIVVSRPSDEGVAWVAPARGWAGVGTAVVILVVALAAGSNWPLATARHAVNLRSRLSPPVKLGDTPNPLELLPARLAHPDGVIFTARVDRSWLGQPTNWLLTTLDVYNGAGWSSDARAIRAGNVLAAPPGVDSAALGPATTATITVAPSSSGPFGLGPWVPTTGVPTGVHPADLAFDPVASVLVAPGGSTRTFTVSGRLPTPSLDQLDRAGVAVSTSDATWTSVPACFPGALRDLAERATADVARPDQEGVAIEQALATRNGFRDDPTSTPGSSCGRLAQFAAASAGTPEQFATAFVLMARTVGLPARLAVGFQPGAIDAARGMTVVHGSDAIVWPEVDFAGLGWVAFDPVPAGGAPAAGGTRTGSTTTVPAGEQGLNAVRQTVADSAATLTPGGSHGRDPVTVTVSPGSDGSTVWWWVAVPGGVVVLGGGMIGLRLGLRRRRRARRRALSDPVASVMGAWAEVLEELDAVGALAPDGPPVRSLTPAEVSAGLSARDGGDGPALAAPEAAGAAAIEPVSRLAQLVDRAVFAAVADGEAVTTAWAASDDATKALRRAVPLGARIRLLLVGASRAGHAHPGGRRRREG